MPFREDDQRDGGATFEPPAPDTSFAALRSLKRAILFEQSANWSEGRPTSPEGLLRRWPVDPTTDPDAASVLVQDFFQRRQHGEEPSIGEYEARFPDQARSLTALVARRSLFRSFGRNSGGEGVSLRLPDVGDVVFGFRLRDSLGRGAFARVFLAEQAELADRPVVLKVSAIEGTEPQTLAQLQHTHIVPIYSVHEDPQAGLRGVCMPYFGGASLSAVLKQVFDTSPTPMTGRGFVAALMTVSAPAPAVAAGLGPTAPGGGQTSLKILAKMTYVEAAIWIVARLAEGLQHAHQRGVLHRDIKPSNILISSEGQPLLLDFNLAHDSRASAAEATLGGTVAYMAPEHLRAINGSSSAPPVDHRSDIYSLGMVIAEMLTGHSPFEQSASYSVLPIQIEAMAVERSQRVPSLKENRPDIPWGLESIVRKCLAPDPVYRYQQAEHLAEDLRRLLDDRPLKFAPELSRLERFQKWQRRNARLATAGLISIVAAAALLAVTASLVGVRKHLARARDRLAEIQVQERLQQHDDQTQRALCLLNTVAEGQGHLREGAKLCESTLALYDLPRGVAGGVHPDLARLAPADRHRVAEDRYELLLLLAGAQVRLQPDKPEVARSSLALLERAEAIPELEPSRALWLDRARYLALLDRKGEAQTALQRAREIPARTARDHYLLAMALAQTGDAAGLGQAIAELDAALKINPRHYWSLMQRGICHLERGELVQAAGDFGQCVGLRPDLAWGYFNRGYVSNKNGQKLGAVVDYDAAKRLDPSFAPAFINGGLARLELRQFGPALADFDRASDLPGGKDDPRVQAGRGMALEGLGRHPEADKAFTRAFELVGQDPSHTRTRLLWSFGNAIFGRDHSRARAAFDEALRDDPRQPQALYGRALLALEAGREDLALADLDRAVAASPEFAEARRGRAILLARKGDWDRAGRDINHCLDHDRSSAENLYCAACVAALAYRKFAEPSVANQALDMLHRAIAGGIAPERAARDPDLASIRHDPRFPSVATPAEPRADGHTAL